MYFTNGYGFACMPSQPVIAYFVKAFFLAVFILFVLGVAACRYSMGKNQKCDQIGLKLIEDFNEEMTKGVV